MNETVPGFIRWLTVGAGRVPQVDTTLTFADRLGAWKARWGIGRMNYMVPPGLYAIGVPTPDDPVVVTANYKMSYDIVRSVLAGRNAWLLVLETFGINVWCAAGKGTFGTEELVRRIGVSDLANAVAHHRLILPILGAPGVAAHEVTKQTGFAIRYATIRAGDIPEYLDNGMVTTTDMRELTFTLRERLALIPVELVEALKPTAIAAAVLFIMAASLQGPVRGLMTVYAYLGAVVAGAAIAPLLLPWLPSRSFAFKGVLTGLAWITAFYLLAGGRGWSVPVTAAAFLAFPAVSAFYTLSFTGCTTYTSRSGVKKEMRIAIPAMGCALIVSILCILAGKLL
jgi:hypothetical protein